MIVTLTRGIAMPRDTNNATCHTQGPDKWHFIFFKKSKKIKKNQKNKKNKKNPQTNTWYVINDVSQLRLKDT